MYRVDPKQAVLDHVSKQPGSAKRAANCCLRPKPSSPLRSSARYRARWSSGVAQVIEALLLATLGFGIYGYYVELGQPAFYIPVILARASSPTCCSTPHAPTASRPTAPSSPRSAACLSAGRLVMVVLAVGIFFFKAGDLLSRVWLASWYGSGAVRSSPFAWRCVRWSCAGPQQGRLKRRTVIVGGGKDAETLIDADPLRAPATTSRLLGLFDDRIDDRSPETVGGLPQARQGRRPHRIRPPHPGRPGHRLDAAIGRKARARHAEAALGAAGRHSALGAYEQAAVHQQGLFLCRRCAGVRHGRPADLGLEPGLQMGVRQGRGAGRADPAVARDARSPRSPSSSRARGRCSSSRSGTASTTS